MAGEHYAGNVLGPDAGIKIASRGILLIGRQQGADACLVQQLLYARHQVGVGVRETEGNAISSRSRSRLFKVQVLDMADLRDQSCINCRPEMRTFRYLGKNCRSSATPLSSIR